MMNHFKHNADLNLHHHATTTHYTPTTPLSLVWFTFKSLVTFIRAVVTRDTAMHLTVTKSKLILDGTKTRERLEQSSLWQFTCWRSHKLSEWLHMYCMCTHTHTLDKGLKCFYSSTPEGFEFSSTKQCSYGYSTYLRQRQPNIALKPWSKIEGKAFDLWRSLVLWGTVIWRTHWGNRSKTEQEGLAHKQALPPLPLRLYLLFIPSK